MQPYLKHQIKQFGHYVSLKKIINFNKTPKNKNKKQKSFYISLNNIGRQKYILCIFIIFRKYSSKKFASHSKLKIKIFFRKILQLPTVVSIAPNAILQHKSYSLITDLNAIFGYLRTNPGKKITTLVAGHFPFKQEMAITTR